MLSGKNRTPADGKNKICPLNTLKSCGPRGQLSAQATPQIERPRRYVLTAPNLVIGPAFHSREKKKAGMSKGRLKTSTGSGENHRKCSSQIPKCSCQVSKPLLRCVTAVLPKTSVSRWKSGSKPPTNDQNQQGSTSGSFHRRKNCLSKCSRHFVFVARDMDGRPSPFCACNLCWI